MDRNPFPRRILFVLLLLISASGHLFSAGNAIAQSRAHSGSVNETPSQRYLPLPQIDSANPRQQLEWLKQLRGVLSENSEASERSALRGLSSDELKVLQEAIRQGDAEAVLRSVEKSGLLPSGLTPEQVSKAVADPALREKVKHALEQFASDSKLSGGSTANRPNGVPFPTNKASPNRADAAASQRQPGSDSTFNDASAPNPRATQSSLEGLSKPSNRQSNGVDGKKSTEDAEPSLSEASLQQPTSPQRDTDVASKSLNPRESTGKGINSGNRNSIPSENARSSSSGVSPVPNETAGPSISNLPRPTESNERLTGKPGADSGPSTSGNAKRTAPVMLPNRDRRADANRTSGSTKATSPSAQGGTFTDAGDGDSTSSRKAMDVADSIRHQQSFIPSSSKTAGSTSASSKIPHTSASDHKPSSVDVRTELEQHGFAATLRQLVAEARRGAENEIAAQRQSGAAKDVQSSWGAMLDGLHEAVTPLPKDAGHDIPAATPLPDSNQSQMTPSARTTVAPSPAPSASSESTSPSDSVLSRVSEAAENALSGMTRPEPAQRIPRAVNGATPTTPDGPNGRTTEGGSVMWLVMLLALLAVGWYAASRVANSMFGVSQAEMLAANQIHPAEISTRRDIVRAFHQFALRPMMPVADWWTHRQVAQQVATSTPRLEPVIQQLAEIYEQARYLPEETVFTPDQIGTARRALEQCHTSLAGGSSTESRMR